MNHPLSLEGKTAVVIGGTSGIGRALSLGLAEAGADVIASARRKEQLEETANEIEARGRRTLRVPSDVSDRASLEDLLRQTLEHFGKADILINCAGKIKRAPTLDFPEDEWQSILDTNLTGTLRACQIFGRHMLQRGYGRIINIASLMPPARPLWPRSPVRLLSSGRGMGYWSTRSPPGSSAPRSMHNCSTVPRAARSC